MFSELRRYTRKDASAPAPVGGDSYAQTPLSYAQTAAANFCSKGKDISKSIKQRFA